MIANQVEAGRGNKRGELGHQVQGLEYQAAGAVVPTALEAIPQPAVGQKRQPFGRQRRTPGITRETLQTHPIACRDGNIGMHAEAGNYRAAAPGQGGKIFRVDLVAHLRQTTPCTRPGGYPAGDRGTIQFGRQRLIMQESVGFFRIGLRSQAPALQQAADTAVNATGHPGHLGIRYPNYDPTESILCSSFDWSGFRTPFVVPTENDSKNAIGMLAALPPQQGAAADSRSSGCKKSRACRDPLVTGRRPPTRPNPGRR